MPRWPNSLPFYGQLPIGCQRRFRSLSESVTESRGNRAPDEQRRHVTSIRSKNNSTNYTIGHRVFRDLLKACAALPVPQDIYAKNDFVADVLETVLNFQMRRAAVTKALAHFEANCRHRIKGFSDLEEVLASDNDDLSVATYLWGNRHWKRVTLLRPLVFFFGAEKITDEVSLKRWAEKSCFKRDFEGRVPGLAFAVYKWLVMRAGVQTIKPDTHLRNFVSSVTGEELDDQPLVDVLTEVAKALNIKPTDLDWRIWEDQRK